jgi:hypothetical protein
MYFSLARVSQASREARSGGALPSFIESSRIIWKHEDHAHVDGNILIVCGLKEGISKKKLSKKGQKRATAYFAK